MSRDFLREEHPIYTLRQAEWETNERRFRGGRGVASELVRFDWETISGLAEPLPKDQVAVASPGDHYRLRQSQVNYPNFPAAFAGTLTGHLMQKRPEADNTLNFGQLGKVRRAEGVRDPSFAELVYYNADGVGSDGSQWDSWWDAVSQWATVTGHRWLFVEAPVRPGRSKQQVLKGQRPYLVQYSPLAVTNWHYEEGRLAWAIIRFSYRRPRLGAGGTLEGNALESGHRLLVRAGYVGLGADFSGGGWWEFDKDGVELEGPTGGKRTGPWEGTEGEIPLWPHFYQRDDEQFSRSGVTELGNAAVAHMNLDSAATFDAWDAAKSVRFLLGVDAEAHETVRKQLQQGSQVVSVPASMDGVVPQLIDSATGAVAAGVLNARLDRIRETAREVASFEITSVPDSSGLSKQMGFAEARAPRLSLLASEVETSQNTALYFLERRFGLADPSASVRWPRQFDLLPLLDRLDRYFGLEERTGYRSAKISARGMVMAAKESGLLADDDDTAKIQAEFAASVAGRIAEDAGRVGQEGEFGVSGDPLEPAA